MALAAALVASVLAASSAVADDPSDGGQASFSEMAAALAKQSGLDDVKPPADVAPIVTAPSDSDGDGTLDAPDAISASLGARNLGKPVEDRSKRTSTTTVTNQADGSTVLKQYDNPVRVERDGQWLDVDPTLEKKPDGTYGPKVSAVDVSISGGGTKQAGTVDFGDGRSLAVTWPQTLPEPTIDGVVATFKLSDATDLLMIAGNDGLAAHLRLNKEPAADDPVFTFGLRADDIAVAEDGDALSLKDDAGKTVGVTSDLVAWDAKTDAAGDPAEKVDLDVDLDQTAKSGDVTTHALQLSAPDGYLSDSDRLYPVTIDPDIKYMAAQRDTWVRSGDSTDHSSDPYLLIGKTTPTANPGAALVQFSLDEPAYIGDSEILEASYSLYQYYATAPQCDARSFNIQPISESWVANGLTWATKPHTRDEDYTTVTQNRSYTCASPKDPGRISIDAKTYVTKWVQNHNNSSTGYPNYGLQMSVAAGDDETSQRRFCPFTTYTANCPNADSEPYLKVKYNKAPATPSTPVINQGGNPITVSTDVSDPNDEQQLKAYIEVRNTADDVVAGVFTNSVAPGNNNVRTVSATLPYLADGKYKVRAVAADDVPRYSGYSAYKDFTVSTDLGSQSSYSTTPHTLSDRASVQVNNRNGNLLVTANDINVNGKGLDLDVTRYFNSQAIQPNMQALSWPAYRWSSSMGYGWSLGVGPDVWMQKRGDNYYYHAPSGTIYGPFTPNGTTAFNSPKGVGADLTKDSNNTSSNTSYTLKFRKSQIKYEFTQIGAAGDLYQTKISDRNDDNNTIRFNYGQSNTAPGETTPNGRAKLKTITDASGRGYTVEYGGTDYIASITEGQGTSPRSWNYKYNNGFLFTSEDPSKRMLFYAYAASPVTSSYLLTSINDVNEANGDTPASVADPIATFTYWTNADTDAEDHGRQLDRIKTVKYQKDATSTVDYSWSYNRGNPGELCNKKNGDFDGSDFASKVKDANGKDTRYCFKNVGASDGGRTRVYDALGNAKSISYTADMNASATSAPQSDAAGGSTAYKYDTTVTDQLSSITEPRTAGDGTTAGQDGDSTTKFTYDHADNADGVSNPAGGAYLPGTVTAPNKSCSSYDYDRQGRTTAAYTGLASSCSRTGNNGFHRRYNDDGTVSSSWDANGSGSVDSQKTIYTYWTSNTAGGSIGQLKTIRKPGGSCDAPRKLCTSYDYDQYGRVTKVTDGRGKITTNTYDKMDRLTGTYFNGTNASTSGNTNKIEYTYDDNGNLLTRTEAAGQSTFTYDRLGRQVTQTIPGTTFGFAYDGNGNLLSQQQTYIDASGSATQPAQTTTYTYDAANRPLTVTNAGLGSGQAATIKLNPDSDGRTTQITFPNSAGDALLYANYTYKDSGKPKEANVKDTSANTKRGYTYDYKYTLPNTSITFDTDQMRKRTIDLPGTTNDRTTSYEYADERIQILTDPGGPNYSYTHDKVGNVLSETSGSTSTYFGYDYAGQLCWRGQTSSTTDKLNANCGSSPAGSTNFSQDAAGNNTNTTAAPTTYNDDSQVSSIGGVAMGYLDRGNDLRVTSGTTSYVNSPLGVTAKKTGTAITYYVRDPNGQILASYGASGTLFYFSEPNGSVAALYDTSGTEVGSYTYSPYGKTTTTGTAAQANPFRYIGGIQDVDSSNNGTFYKLGARYYDAQGHFTQPDSIAGTINDPRTLTSYNYAGGDPINYSDPSGNSLLSLVDNIGLAGDIVEFGYDVGTGNFSGAASTVLGFAAGAAASTACAAGTFVETIGTSAVACYAVGSVVSESVSFATDNYYEQTGSFY